MRFWNNCAFLMRFVFRKTVLMMLCILVLVGYSEAANESGPAGVAVVISQRIRPFMSAAEGLTQGLAESNGISIKTVELDRYRGKAQDALADDLNKAPLDLFVAIGPDAAVFVRTRLDGGKPAGKLYTMILRPERILGDGKGVCGIPLGLSAQSQLQVLSENFPALKRVGILYDPANNAEFVNQATQSGRVQGIAVVPMAVQSRAEIPPVLKAHWMILDALWLIPDQTVITETLVEYMVKEALSNKVAVIGYNRFFYECGAVLAFVFDYHELGVQTARLARRMLSGQPCVEEPPRFHVWVNPGIADFLGLPLKQPLSFPVEVGP